MGFLDRLTSVLVGDDDVPAEVRQDLDRARAWLDGDDVVRARKSLEELARNHPRIVPVQVMLGEVQLNDGQVELAIGSFGRAIDVDAHSVAGWLGLGRAEARADRSDQALHAFRRVIALTGSDTAARAQALAGRAEMAMRQGESERALRELKRAHEILPDDISIAAAMGRAMVATGDAEGQRWLLHAARHAQADPALVLEATRGLVDSQAAIALLRGLAERVRPVDDASRRQRAEIVRALVDHLIAVGSRDEPLVLAAASLAESPDDPAVLAAWKNANVAAGRYGEALQAAERLRLGGPDRDNPEVIAASVSLALGAADSKALERLGGDLEPQAPLGAAIRAFVAGAASDDDVRMLLELAPDDSSHRFVARSLAPAPPPATDLFALLQSTHDLLARPGPLMQLGPRAAHALEAYDRPLLLAIMGEFNAGKSSLVNALCGSDLAPVGVTPTTATINILRHGDMGGRVVYQDGQVRKLPAKAVAPFLLSLVGQDAGGIRAVEVFMPVPLLERMEIVDTPGMNAVRAEHEALAQGYLIEADAIVWVFAAGQVAKRTEQQALQNAHDAGKPVIGIINKADQVDSAELPEIVAHVREAFGATLTEVIAVSARSADPASLAMQEVFHRHLLGRERELKRRTALAVLARLLGEGQLLVSAAAPVVELGEPASVLQGQRESAVGSLARQRLRFGERLRRGFSDVADSVAELLRPAGILDGLTGFPGDRAGERERSVEFVADVLEDVTEAATAATVEAFASALVTTPEVPDLKTRLRDVSFTNAARFVAYARGSYRHGLAERVLQGLRDGKADEDAIVRILTGSVPDHEQELFGPLSAAIDATLRAAERDLSTARRAARALQTMHQERYQRPLELLLAALETLTKREASGPSPS